MRLTFACVLGLLLSALPAQASSHDGSSTMTIRLMSTTVSIKPVTDRAPTGVLSPGDVLSARSILRNASPQFGKAKGAIVGSDVGRFTLVSANVSDVKVVAKLPGGTVRLAGTVRDTRSQTLRVTGGTGAFAGARGTSVVRTVNASAGLASNVYRLQLP